MIEPAQVTIVITSIDKVRVEGIGNDISAFEACCRFPVFIGDTGPGRPAFYADAGIILLRSQDMIRECVVGGDPVDLRSGLIIDGAPVLPLVEAYLGAPVIGEDHAVTIFRVQP